MSIIVDVYNNRETVYELQDNWTIKEAIAVLQHLVLNFYGDVYNVVEATNDSDSEFDVVRTFEDGSQITIYRLKLVDK